MKPLLLLLKKQVHEIMSPDHPHLFETGIRKYQLVSMVPECLVSSSSFLWLVSENANDSSIFETNVWELQHMTSVVIFEAGVWERLCLISIFKTGCPRTPMPGRRVFWHLRTLTPLFKSCSLCRCVRKPMSRPLPFFAVVLGVRERRRLVSSVALGIGVPRVPTPPGGGNIRGWHLRPTIPGIWTWLTVLATVLRKTLYDKERNSEDIPQIWTKLRRSHNLRHYWYIVNVTFNFLRFLLTIISPHLPFALVYMVLPYFIQFTLFSNFLYIFVSSARRLYYLIILSLHCYCY